MLKYKLNESQIMTMGVKVLSIFVVFSGWIRKRRIKMAQIVLIIVDDVISNLTIFRPWIAPRTDWADVSILSDMINDTLSTPTIFNNVFKKALLFMKFLADLLSVLSSLIIILFILIVRSFLGSRLTILAYLDNKL